MGWLAKEDYRGEMPIALSGSFMIPAGPGASSRTNKCAAGWMRLNAGCIIVRRIKMTVQMVDPYY
jgi:hypothetical protein